MASWVTYFEPLVALAWNAMTQSVIGRKSVTRVNKTAGVCFCWWRKRTLSPDTRWGTCNRETISKAEYITLHHQVGSWIPLVASAREKDVFEFLVKQCRSIIPTLV